MALESPPETVAASSPICPGCGTAIDPLRAGHVAIYDGLFRYYCNATCKALHLRAVATAIGDDVPTLDPPAVAERFAAMNAGTLPDALPANGKNGSHPTIEARARNANATNGAQAQNGTNGAHTKNGTNGAHAENGTNGAAKNGTNGTTTTVEEATALPLGEPVSEPTADVAPSSDVEAPAVEPSAVQARSAAAPTLPIPTFLPPTVPPVVADESAELPALPLVRDVILIEHSSSSIEPRTLRSPIPTPVAVKPAAGAIRLPNSEQVRRVVSALGSASGLLALVLVIADVGLRPRLALACIAGVAFLLRLVLAPRDPADANVAAAAIPVLGTVGAAIAASADDNPHAATLTVLAGLSSAIAIAVEEAIAWSRDAIDAQRCSIAKALDVESRVLRGDGPSITQRDVKAGELVLVEQGDVVGVDGVVRAGTAVVVPWHLAPIDMSKVEGDAIVAGAKVVSGRLRIVTAWAGAERAWSRAIASRSVRSDVSAPTVMLARMLLERGAPAIAIVAALAAMGSGGSSGWIDAVATACAAWLALGGRGLVAAVSLVHAHAQMKALSHGIVYKDAQAFDAAGRAAIAVACSRGTVLTGEPEIVAIEATPSQSPPADESRILALAAGAETASTHPFADAILRAAQTRGLTPENVRSATVHAGLGVTALSANGERLVVGSRALLLQEKVSVAVAEARASELEAQGRSVLLVALAGKLVGLVALQDGLRAGARAAVQRLLDAKIEPVLLSGESRETCETIARALEIDHVRPEVLPADRGTEVRALAEGGQVVAVIGHPASDDGALGSADLAVAMGAPRAPGEWGVWLASDDVRDAALALSLAHGARDRSRLALAVGLVPGAVVLLALGFGVASLVCAPVALALAVAASLAIAHRVD